MPIAAQFAAGHSVSYCDIVAAVNLSGVESETLLSGCAGEGDQERPSCHVLQLRLLRAGHRHRKGVLVCCIPRLACCLHPFFCKLQLQKLLERMQQTYFRCKCSICTVLSLEMPHMAPVAQVGGTKYCTNGSTKCTSKGELNQGKQDITETAI